MIDGVALAKVLHHEARAIVAYDRTELELSPDQKLERALTRWPIPPVDELGSVIEDVFWASHLTEESRPCRARLLYLPHDDGRSSIHRFSAPVRLDREKLRKLSPAHGPLGYLIWRRASGRPVVSGVHAREGGEPPAELTIVASAAGTLHFTWASFRLATFRAGSVHRATDFAPRTNVALGLMATLLETFEPHLGGPILDAMTEQGHGGALWVVGEGTSLAEVHVGHAIAEEQGALLERFADSEARHGWLTSIAHLAAVDGAVVLDGRLRVLGFAAYVHMGDDVLVDRTLPDRSIERVPSSKLGGARHWSAVEFCRLNAPAVAIVFSEDGRVTLIVADAARNIVCTELGRGFSEPP